MPSLNSKSLLPLFVVALMAVFAIHTPQIVKAEELSVESVPGAETIDVKKAKELFDQGVTFQQSGF